MRIFLLVAIASMAMTIIFPSAAFAQSMMEQSEGVVGKTVKNYRFIDHNGKYVPFYDFKGSPVLLSFIFTECPGPCQLIGKSIENLRDSFSDHVAKNIKVLSVTIDPGTDTPEILKEYRETFTDDDSDDWRFAHTDIETLKMMVEDLGFFYEEKGNTMDHMNRLTLIGPDSVVAKHFYGMEYDPVEVESAIVAILEGRTLGGRLTSMLDWALIYCSDYDPVSKTYKIDYAFLASIALQHLSILVLVLYYFRNEVKGFFRKLLNRGEQSAG